MKQILILLVVTILAGGGGLLAGDVKVGDSEKDVRRAMGEPIGTIKIGSDEKIFSYGRGEIYFKDGKVSKLDFLPGGKTFKDLQNNSDQALKKRQEYDAQMKSRAVQKFMEKEKFEDLTEEQKVAKLKELQANNPNLDVSKDIKDLNKAIEEDKKKNGGNDNDKKDEKKDEGPKPDPTAPNKNWYSSGGSSSGGIQTPPSTSPAK
ncbi:MAG: hypothetical protein SFY92_03230 [Verrucomicrobiae bacterium]|nr:hypothetical protein [Verrucomicrobiae bacterium]